MPESRKSALPATEEARMAYATVVAMMAAADDVVVIEELDELHALCESLDLSDEQTARIIATASNRDREAFAAAIEQMKASNLRFTLMADCIALTYADHELAEAETASLEELAQALAITGEQLASLQDYAEAVRKAADGKGDDHEATGRKLAGSLAAAGVPVGVLGVGSALALSATGAASGLSALAAGLGIATGFGAVLGLGVGTVYGLRWLRRQISHRGAAG